MEKIKNIPSNFLFLGKKSIFVRNKDKDSKVEFLKPQRTPPGCSQATIGGNKNPVLVMYGDVPPNGQAPLMHDIWPEGFLSDEGWEYISQYDRNIDKTILAAIRVVPTNSNGG